MSSSKKLKMERLSPIPMVDRTHVNLSDSCRTPSWCVTPKVFRKHKDRYAIESSSSPEVDKQTVNSSKFRKTKNSSVRNRVKSVPKKHVSTPLSGLIARKSLCQPSRELPSVSGCQATSDKDLAVNIDSVASQLHTSEELKTVGGDVDQMPYIGAFQSPLKPKILNPIRHSEMLTPGMVFPSLQHSDASKNTPLSKKLLGHSRSLNDSMSILVAADVEMYEDNFEDTDRHNVDPPSIECFESPSKPSLDKNYLGKSFDFPRSSFSRQVNFVPRAHIQKQPLETIVEENTSKSDTSVEMSGSERKKRKRALDFSSQTFPFSKPPEQNTVSPPFLSHSSAERSPVLDHDPQLLIPRLESPLQQSDMITNEDSEAESVIEGTPKQEEVLTEIKDDPLSGFTVCSSLTIDVGIPPSTTKDFAPIFEINSPLSMSQPKVEILEETSNDGFPGLGFDLNLVCHDTSSDESEVECSINQIEDKSCFIIPNVPEAQGFSTKSPPLNFNCTKREIQPYESPCKVTKAFSEAINIGVFGSPDSNACSSYLEVAANEKEDEGDDIINVTTTQEEDEFVDESEQIRPTKRRKKGSLLERAGFVISRVDASNALFDYEIKAGLRPSTGKFVSSSLVVCKMWAGESSTHILICKSLKFCKMDLQERPEAKRTFIVAIIVNKIAKEVSEGSVVLLHYPLTIVHCDSFGIPYILAGHQLVLDSKEPKFNHSHVLNINSDLIDILNRPLKLTKNPASTSSVNVFPFTSIKNFTEAALCQCLVDEFELSLRVLHFVIDVSEPNNKKALVLCSDMDKNFGWIQFTLEHDVKRAVALEALHILVDGALIQVRGFHVFDRPILDMKTKNLLNYCLSEIVESTIIFTLIPIELTWVVSSTGQPRDAKKVAVTIDNIQLQKTRGKRFLIEITSTGFDEDQNLIVADSSGKSVIFIQGELAPKMRFELLTTPFFLDAVYYYDGKIFSDEYTKLIPNKLHSKL